MTVKRLIIGFSLTCAILVGAVAMWATGGNFHAVIPGQFYRSAQIKPERLEDVVNRYGIKTIINVRGTNVEHLWYQDQQEALRRLGVAFHDVALSAREMPDIIRLDKLIDALQKSQRPTLVHCFNGADRSGLATVVALLMDGNHKLDDVRWQTSLYFQIIHDDSAGKQFLRQYESWLKAKGQKHAPDRLFAWIKNDYDDYEGNLQFIFDGVNGQVGSGRSHTFRVDGNVVSAWGWAFDSWRRDLLGAVTVMLDDRPLQKTRYRLNRKDVADYFEIPAVELSGWEVKADLTGWPRKCYGASLRMTRLDGSEWRSPPLAKVCLN
jgi:protein tyrosine phosphatase (PTP) superfamily phosphohydrolase (DUF442 family)